jgi:hypothetical protein
VKARLERLERMAGGGREFCAACVNYLRIRHVREGEPRPAIPVCPVHGKPPPRPDGRPHIRYVAVRVIPPRPEAAHETGGQP